MTAFSDETPERPADRQPQPGDAPAAQSAEPAAGANALSQRAGGAFAIPLEATSCVVTHHETLLCVSEAGTLLHAAPESEFSPLLVFQVEGGAWFLRRNRFGRLEAMISDGVAESPVFSEAGTPLVIGLGGSPHDAISFHSSSLNLSAMPDGTAAFTQSHVLPWESYALIAFETFDWLRRASDESWHETSSRQRVLFDGFRKREAHTFVACGPVEYRLSGRPGPILGQGARDNEVEIFGSFERRRSFIRIEPVVYFCVFGSDQYYKCMALAVTSLRLFGQYNGDIIIIADRDERTTLSYILNPYTRNVRVESPTSHSPLYERYHIFSRNIRKYCPVIYLDIDIIVSGDISSLVIDAACDPGLHLYREDRADICSFNDTESETALNWHGGWMLGFGSELGAQPFLRATSGIMMFNDHDATQRIFTNILKVAALTRRYETDRFGDQPIMNYAAIQSESVDIEMLRGKSLNGSHPVLMMEDTHAILKHVSLGVGMGHEKLDIMNELFDLVLTRSRSESPVKGD
ncbi:glycosyltransferase family protein [Tanticharoenia sakaeratensis]|uniref:Uncharacterized protein n=1 Tax=Tanticharoenia sakaeratensis NBRC 103193 TaxID=1231623 RepID=A0A0D6MIN9_9PROT|nr:hypothetical protein [Tanticharoenia sakaeratensis]GAN53310.1 hypothetical protein Tasa_009_105 [Tanticharoenia sakaeratensis NBRC 103193]GBQ21010.1 hypothetical protein AA103193_1582 [Tanticharoenia sakaeratensis NBRC 103193]